VTVNKAGVIRWRLSRTADVRLVFKPTRCTRRRCAPTATITATARTDTTGSTPAVTRGCDSSGPAAYSLTMTPTAQGQHGKTVSVRFTLHRR
jgi:hypothetical protein